MPKGIPATRWARARARAPSAVRSGGVGVGYLGGPLSQAGVYVTPDTALNYAAVFAATSIISTDCAAIPTLVYRISASGGREASVDNPWAELLQVEGNPEVDAFHLISVWIVDALLRGNGYLQIVRDARTGRPLRLWRIDPRDCTPKRNAAGRLIYDLDNGKALLPEDVLHLKGFTRDGIVGTGIVTLARQTIGVGASAELTAAGMFGRGSKVSGFIKSQKKLSPEAQAEIRAFFSGEYGGPFNSGKVATLTGDMEWIPADLSPEDGQFLATRAFNIHEVCRWFNINPIKLQDYSNGRFSNIEQAQFDHLQATLMPWLIRAEVEFNRKLLTPEDRRTWIIRHDVDERLRGDSATRWSNYQKAFGMGVYTQNDILRKEGMNTFDGGDKHYFPSNNFTPVSDPAADPPKPEDKPADPAPDPTRDAARVPRPAARAELAADAARAAAIEAIAYE